MDIKLSTFLKYIEKKNPSRIWVKLSRRGKISAIFDVFRILYYLFSLFQDWFFCKKFQNPRFMFSHNNPKENVGSFITTIKKKIFKKKYLTSWSLNSMEYELDRKSVWYLWKRFTDLICWKSLGYWLTPAVWPHMTSGEGRDYKRSFVSLHRVEMQSVCAGGICRV